MKVNSEKQQAQQLLNEGQIDKAALLIQNHCSKNPNDAEAQYILGQCYALAEQYPQAKKAFKNSISLYPNMPWSHFALAGVLLFLGELDEAIKSLQFVLSLDENIHEAELAIVNILIIQDRLHEARLILVKLQKIIPDNSDLYVQLSRIERAQRNQEKVIHYLEKALQLDEESIPALCDLASIKTFHAKKDEAENYYRRALKLSPNNPDIISGLAMLYSYQNDSRKVYELISPLLVKNILNEDLGKVLIRTCKDTGKSQEAIAYIQQLLEKKPMTKNTRSNLYFELGREFDRIGRYDDAFESYRQGNALSKIYYNENENISRINEIIETFDKKNLSKFKRANHSNKRPVFIIGMPRSGTSLTEQVLASHPDVCAGGELIIIDRMTLDLSKTLGSTKPYPKCVELITQDIINKLADKYLDYLSSISDKEKRVTNKMPRDFYDLGMISLLFPDAYIIHCQRNAIDNCLSVYFQNFAGSDYAYSNDLKMTASYYRQYQRLMKHWSEVLSVNIFNLQYEDLVRNQESITRQLLEFCDLGWNKNCMNFHKLDRTIATASFDQVRQPLYEKSVNRWKNYQKFIDEIHPILRFE